jgi:hypothetical protein
MEYVSLPFNKKLNLLREHSLDCEWPNLEQEHWCLHCGKKFSGHSARVWKSEDGALWLECGTAKCNGSPIDWAPFPWWDPKNPETKRALRGKSPKSKPGKRHRKNDDSDDVPF